MPELVHLLRPEHLARQMLVLGGELLRLLAERVRRELVRGHVREVARAVRAVRDDRSPLDGCAQLAALGVADHDPFGRSRLVLAPSSGPASTRRGSSPRPAPRPGRAEAPGGIRRAARRAFRRRARARAPRQRPPCAERPRRRPRGLRLRPRRGAALRAAVEVQQDRLAALAAQVPALAKLPEEAVELLVEVRRRVAAGLPSDGERKRIRSRLPRKGDLDLRHGSRWYLGGA